MVRRRLVGGNAPRQKECGRSTAVRPAHSNWGCRGFRRCTRCRRARGPRHPMNRLAQLLEGRAKFGLVAGALMWVIWGVGSVLGPGNLDLNGQVIGTDHSAFHTAAVVITEGRGDVLFQYPDLAEFQAKQEQLVGKSGFLD